jgi:hypothetical protein
MHPLEQEPKSNKKWMWIGLSLLLVSSVGITGLPPTTLSGLFDTVKSTVFNFIVPNNLATKVTGGALIETGNKNILTNPSFEHSTYSTGWNVLNINCPASVNTSTVIEGKQSLAKTCNFTGDAPDVYQDSTLYEAQFADGVQGIASIRVKTDAEGMYVCPRRAGATLTDLCVAVASDNKWGLYQIPFVLGGTSNGIIVTSNLATINSKTIYIDDAFVGAIGAMPTVSNVGPWINGTCTSNWVTNTTTTCKYRQNGEDLEIQFKAATSGAPTAVALIFTMPSGFALDTEKIVVGSDYIIEAGECMASDGGAAYYPCQVLPIDTTRFSIRAVNASSTYANTSTALSSTVPITFGAGDYVVTTVRVPVTSFRGSSSVFTSQCGASCVDTYSAKISAAGVVSGENVDWINGNFSITSTSQFTGTYNTNIFTAAPNCSISVFLSAGNSAATRDVVITAESSTGITYYTSANGTTPTAYGAEIICQKTGSDFVATRMIQGSFLNTPAVPGIQKPKTIKYIFGGGTLASPAVCAAASPCGELFDPSNAVSNTRASGGVYQIVIANGTFAPSTAIDCRCTAFYASAARLECDLYNNGNQTVSTNASGGYTVGINTQTPGSTVANPASTESWVSISCEGQAP